MAFFIGYFGAPFLIAYLIVDLGLKKDFEKKHGVPMSGGQVAARTLGIGLILLFLALYGSIL